MSKEYRYFHQYLISVVRAFCMTLLCLCTSYVCYIFDVYDVFYHFALICIRELYNTFKDNDTVHIHSISMCIQCDSKQARNQQNYYCKFFLDCSITLTNFISPVTNMLVSTSSTVGPQSIRMNFSLSR